MTRRDVCVALIAAVATASVALAWQQQQAIGSSVFDWTKMTATKTAVGEVRQVMRAPTATLKELEVHITTLNPGQSPHAPHRHPNEELILLDTGTVEAYQNGVWTRVGAGSVIFNASNQLHGLRNVGSTPATYHVVNWQSDETPAPKP